MRTNIVIDYILIDIYIKKCYVNTLPGQESTQYFVNCLNVCPPNVLNVYSSKGRSLTAEASSLLIYTCNLKLFVHNLLKIGAGTYLPLHPLTHDLY